MNIPLTHGNVGASISEEFIEQSSNPIEVPIGKEGSVIQNPPTKILGSHLSTLTKFKEAANLLHHFGDQRDDEIKLGHFSSSE